MRHISSFLFLATFLLQTFAFAGLGENEASIEKDKLALKLEEPSQPAVKTSSKAHFSVREMSHSSLHVKEYVNPNGVVFGVTWKANSHPDFAALLGPYFGEYQEALKNRKRMMGNRRAATITGPHIVVETSGTMRAMQGRAYVPTLIPSGASVNDIQ